jgi:hypothetical protein
MTLSLPLTLQEVSGSHAGSLALLYCTVHNESPKDYTIMRRLTTGIPSTKCFVRRFCRCTNVIECTYTYPDSIAYYTTRLYDIACCSETTNLLLY